jgi:tRNA dimethylallyltransferase
MNKNKILIICGPTATGKTGLGISLAKKFSGEIVSADSRQVYKGMDIGTGKDLPVNSKFQIPKSKIKIPNSKFQIGYYFLDGIPIWLYDVADPDYRFNVADYISCSEVVIKDIWRRKKLPILVGGTGFYIKALIDGIQTLGIAPDWELREKLKKLGVEKLREILKEIDPERLKKMNESDRNNPRRLIRAIEIAKKIQNSKFKIKNSKLKIDSLLIIGLKAPYRVLYERIDKRVGERVNQGIEEEIKILLKRGYNWENSALGTTLGYKEWQPYFENLKSKEEIIQKWKYEEHAYARRQMIWFKKDKRIYWFDISKVSYRKEIEKLIEKWYIKD